MDSIFPPKLTADIPETEHLPKYKEFLFDGTVTLCVGPHRRRIEIHKKLLASISPELNKHVNNDMKEGIEGIIYLPDDEEKVLALYTEWAYTGEYAYEDDKPVVISYGSSTGNPTQSKQNPWQNLHMHLQLYVFSDKFNIPTLKKLAGSEFYQNISPVVPQTNEDAVGLLMVITFAFDNLPDSDPILKFLAQYASWKLALLRGREGFNQLILTQAAFMKELLVNLTGLPTKPMPPHTYPHLQPPTRPRRGPWD
ncbi:hypothetical protein L873DRAFT_1823275 [Choiromyces venosus 120613-1]|uniref:BTB domain-containing protein n=1 Tax=Choiromyces venosus 120613-1 TaxID=1336337 RepID=A0A3N4ITX7_9PEZI|nr:hypothetical protein L873DRAFT_1823275 [Choiromyces venosus 120613-1]